MFDKKILYALLQKQQYDAILDILQQEYTHLITNFLVHHSIIVSEKDTLWDLLQQLKHHFPSQEGISLILSQTFWNEELSTEEKIELLVENYTMIRHKLSKSK